MTDNHDLPKLPDRFYVVPNEPRHRESLKLMQIFSELDDDGRRRVIDLAAEMSRKP